MASPFETEGTFLTQEQADHINERHVFFLGTEQRRCVDRKRGLEGRSWELLFVRV